MKYKVSLLPEKNRKRIIGKRKAEKGRSVANVIMLVLLATLFIALLGKTIADVKLQEAHDRNAPYEAEILALQEYENIDKALQNKLQLIESIQVQEPALYNFLASVSNVERAGISMKSFTCTDWKTSRTCAITGSAVSYDSLETFIENLKGIQGTTVNVTSLTQTVYNGSEVVYEFSISVTCSGGAAVPVETSTTETTAAAQ